MDIEESYLRVSDIQEIFGIGRSTVYDLLKKKQLPPPVHLGRTTLFLKSEIAALMHKKAVARGGE